MAQEHREHYRVTATDETQRALASVRRGFEQVEGAIAGVQRATAGLVGIAAAALSVNHFLQAAAGAEVASNRLSAVLRATGGAAGYTKQQLDAMADSMADSTMFDDEAIRDAQSTLLKFGDIQGDVFERGMKLAADYASFTGSEIQDAAQVIGKALQSPEEGVGALERQIGKLTYTQKESIKGFMEQGRVMDAQNVILDILQKKIGGTSDLINTGLNKSLNDIKKNWGEFSESVGKSAPADSFLTFVNQSLKDMKAIIESGDWLAGLKFIAGFRGMDIKPMQDPSKSGGAIMGGPGDPRLKARLAEIDAQIEAARKKQGEKKEGAVKKELTFDELLAKAAAKRIETQENAERDGEQAANRATEANDKLRESVVDLIDPSAQYVRLLEKYRQAMDDGIITTEQYTEAAFILNDKIEEVIGNKLPKEIDKATDSGRELGLIFESAASQAMRDWQGVGNLIRSIGVDIAQMMLKKTVIDPASGFFSSALGGLGGSIGGSLAGMLTGGSGGGGYVGAGDMDFASFAGGGSTGSGARAGGMDGQGGFPAMLHPNETVIDHALGQRTGASIVQNIHFSANTPAAVRDAVFALAPQLTQASIAAVRDERNRTGDRR